jgi:putative colanic acid biosynthesis glycosyltransferase
MKIFQINTTVNSGSTGRIAEDIGVIAMNTGYSSYIAASYTGRPSKSEIITIGNSIDRTLHGVKSRLLDGHGFGSAGATRVLVKKIKEVNPDVIHLHNLHGYYLHVGILFDFLKKAQIPVVWTLHDCWPFTGHCAHFERVNCNKWQVQCCTCPLKSGYPASWGLDNSRKNYLAKREIFNGVKKLHIVAPSKWLAGHLKKSFLNSYPVHLIYNGIDLNSFYPRNTDDIRRKYDLQEANILLGVASTWKRKKALKDFIRLSQMIGDTEKIVLVGMSRDQISRLPPNIIGIERTESLDELAALYSAASVLLNPTYVDTFPNTNIESLACGTPVITYRTGGSPEAIDENTGIVVDKENLLQLHSAIQSILKKGKAHYQQICRNRVRKYFNKEDRFGDYLSLYYKLISDSV